MFTATRPQSQVEVATSSRKKAFRMVELDKRDGRKKKKKSKKSKVIVHVA